MRAAGPDTQQLLPSGTSEFGWFQELSGDVGVRYQDVDPPSRDGTADGVQFAHASGDADAPGYAHHGFGFDRDHSLFDRGFHGLAVDVEEAQTYLADGAGPGEFLFFRPAQGVSTGLPQRGCRECPNADQKCSQSVPGFYG